MLLDVQARRGSCDDFGLARRLPVGGMRAVHLEETTSLRFNSIPSPTHCGHLLPLLLPYPTPCPASSVFAAWQRPAPRCAPSHCFAPLLAQLRHSRPRALLLVPTLLLQRQRRLACLLGPHGNWLHWRLVANLELTYATDAQGTSPSNMQPSVRRSEAMRKSRL